MVNELYLNLNTSHTTANESIYEALTHNNHHPECSKERLAINGKGSMMLHTRNARCKGRTKHECDEYALLNVEHKIHYIQRYIGS